MEITSIPAKKHPEPVSGYTMDGDCSGTKTVEFGQSCLITQSIEVVSGLHSVALRLKLLTWKGLHKKPILDKSYKGKIDVGKQYANIISFN